MALQMKNGVFVELQDRKWAVGNRKTHVFDGWVTSKYHDSRIETA